jgi:hypothetical protein
MIFTAREASTIVCDRDLVGTEASVLGGILASCKKNAENGVLWAEWDHWETEISERIHRSLLARGFELYVHNNIFRVAWGVGHDQFGKVAERLRKNLKEADEFRRRIQQQKESQ